MVYREIIAVCSQIHTKHINSLCKQKAELLNVEPGGTLQEFNKQSPKRNIGTVVQHIVANVCKEYFKGNAV